MATNLNAPALPPGFELEQQPGMGIGGGTLPGEGVGPGREVAGSRVDPRQAVREPAQPPARQPRMAAQPPAAAPMQSAALPPGFELEQPAPAPVAPPPREVGMGEGIARIVGQAAIPVAKTLGLATASLANLVGGREAADAVFRKTDEVVGDMQREYEFRPNEEVGLPTQIAGGVLSTPIELVGGFGTQHGINRAAEVLQRGGTGSEAATAGGVSGAVHAGLNLLPVKAGGAVGRVAERVVEKGVGRALAPTVAGGITGGTIAGGGDVLGTAAENAALPEGEQFQDLRQEASPGISAGLGAAFGAGAGRGSRASRKARAEAAPEPSQRAPAGSEAPAGSVGAAGADVEMQRRQRAAALPVPIELSKGEAMGAEGKHAQMQFERETAKDAETGEALRQAAAEKNDRLQRNLEVMIEDTGAEIGTGPESRQAVGEAVSGALQGRINEWKDRIQQAYRKAREAGDMAEPVSTARLVDYLNEKGPESINAKVLQTVREKLVQLGGAKRDGEGGLVAGEMPINDLEEVRKMINRVSETPVDMHFGGELKSRIDAATENVGGDLYREARRLRTEYGREFGDRAVINDLVRTKRGSADRAVGLHEVFRRSILNRGPADVIHLRDTLNRAGEAGRQAWKELQGQTLRHIQEQATKNVQRDIRGNPITSAAGLDRAIKALDADGRLDAIFGKKGAEQLRDLNDVANNVLTSPPGAVNTSNTAATLRQHLGTAFDTAITFMMSGAPVPAWTVFKKARQELANRKVKRQVSEALAQPEGLLPAEGAERARFNAEANPNQVEAAAPGGTEPPVSGTEGVPRETAAPAAATDPRLAELERLRAATTNPEAHAVLDERKRKVEREIAASRKEARQFQQADELDALARSSTDPDVRKALAERADKLRGGAIPVGEAEEVTVQHAAPIEPTKIPVGEAIEVQPEEVQPAPRPPEAPRSAAGSDTEAELTMLQPGAPARGTKKQPMYKRAGIKAPETPEFRRWFGESKVVDEAGAPMVVFHGTKGDVSEFKMRSAGKHDHGEYGRGFYFSPHADTASLYADLPQHAAEPGAPNVMPTFVSLKNPARLERNQSVDSAAEAAALTKKLKAAGHDGVMVYDKGKLLEIVAFDPAQIKSAIGNRGTFNPSDRGIMNKQGGGLPMNPFKQRAELENNLRAKFGHKLIDALQKRNVITMGEAPADVPRDAQGRFTGSTVELFHDRLDADTAPGVLMHEVGMHYGMEKMLGEQRYAELLDDVAKMRQRPEVARAWQQVLDAYELKEGSPEFLSEVAAHLVESAPGQPIVRRIIDAPRAYLYRQFGVNVGKTDPGLLRALAVGALRKSAGVEAVSPNVASLATAGAQREEETAAQ